MKLLLLTIAIIIAVISKAIAQSDTLVITLKNSQMEKIAVADILKIKFENITSVENADKQAEGLQLKGNYPNPFSTQTEIEFEIEKTGKVEVNINNSVGVLVKTLNCINCPAGRNTLLWDGIDQNGKHAASGNYYYEVRYEDVILYKNMLLLK